MWDEDKIIDLKKTIVFVGMPGCGKSAIGKRLAERLGIPFHDSDAMIEKDQGCKITSIFEEKGEDYFRQLEKNTINKLVSGEVCIVSPGGGAFIDLDTRKLIQDKSLSIWLNASYDILLERVKSKNTRPLLERGDKAEILRELFDTRLPIYEEAHLEVQSTNIPHHYMIDYVIDSIDKYNKEHEQ